MAKSDLLKEAIADAKAVKETALQTQNGLRRSLHSKTSINAFSQDS